MNAFKIHEYISDKLKVSHCNFFNDRCEYHIRLDGVIDGDEYNATLTEIRGFLKMLKSLDPECERLYDWFNLTEIVNDEGLAWDLFIDFNEDLGDRTISVFIDTLLSRMVKISKRGSLNPKANALMNKQMDDFYSHLKNITKVQS